MELACAMCGEPADGATPDKKHAICSSQCGRLAMQKMGTPLPALPNAPSPDKQQLLSVHGTGEVRVMPDRVRVALEVIREATTVAEVNQKIIKAADALLSLLKDRTQGRAQKIQTDDLVIEPLYEPEPPAPVIRNVRYDDRDRVTERKIVSYQAIFPISFQSTVDQTASLIDLCLKDNVASGVRGLRYVVSEEIARPAYSKALELASLDAEAQARVVLNTLHMKERGIVAIEIRDNGRGGLERVMHNEESYVSFKQKKSLRTAQANMQLIAPEEAINATVYLVIAYE